jgi:4-hydroxy-tetrahydrodipicolinate reductase
MSDTIVLLINGVCGRMGQRVALLAAEDPSFQVAAALESVHHPKLGHDLGELIGQPALEGVKITQTWPANNHIEVVIDFSSPDGTAHLLKTCRRDHIPMVVATTGHSATQMHELQEAGHEMPILLAANLSLGMNLMMKLLKQTTHALKDQDFDIEIIEKHHRFKKDSPSGTALKLAHIVQEDIGLVSMKHGREGLTGERPKHEIGIHSIRAGDEVGDHTVMFSTLGETFELHHRATNRDAFAKGALEAARFLANQAPGWYTMADVLGFDD